MCCIGGYMDDLWIYTKWLDDETTKKKTFMKNDGIHNMLYKLLL